MTVAHINGQETKLSVCVGGCVYVCGEISVDSAERCLSFEHFYN